MADNIVLKDRDSGKPYKVLHVEGIAFNEEVVMPESGCVPLTLYFEPLDAQVMELNCIEPNAHPNNGIYGIQLHSRKNTTQKKDKDSRPFSTDYYLQQPFTADAHWHFV